ARLSGGDRPTGIPINVWAGTKSAGRVQLPASPILEDADRNAIILLIDWTFFNARERWQEYLDSLAERLRPGDLLLPISICGDAQRTAKALADINCVPVRDPQNLRSDEHLFQAVLTALLRLLGGSPDRAENSSPPAPLSAVLPDVFLCHSKAKTGGGA